MKRYLITLPLVALVACGPETRESCYAEVERDASDLQVEIARTKENLARGYGIGGRKSESSFDFWTQVGNVDLRSKCEGLLPNGNIGKYGCRVQLGGMGGSQIIELDMEEERRLQQVFIQRLGDPGEYLARGAAECAAKYP